MSRVADAGLPTGFEWRATRDGRWALRRRWHAVTWYAALVLLVVLPPGVVAVVAPRWGAKGLLLALFVGGIPYLGSADCLGETATRHQLVVGRGVEHRWRSPFGPVRSAPVAAVWIHRCVAEPDDDGEPPAECWRLSVDHLDGSGPHDLWRAAVPSLRELGRAVHEAGAVPFDPEPRMLSPHSART
jgi:hypothetical protein